MEPAVQNNRRRKFKLSADMVILAMASLAFCLSMFLMFNDGVLFRSNDRSLLPPVGKAISRTNDVRRRVQGGLAWSAIAKDDEVYEGDAIFTGDESQAVIRIGESGELALDPRSLVVIRTQDAKAEIDLKYGTLVGKVATNAPIVIAQNGERKEVTAQNAEVKITKSKGAAPRIHVVKGEIQIKAKPQPVAAKSKGKDPETEPAKAPAPVAVQVVKQSESIVLKETAPTIARGDIELQMPADKSVNWFEKGKTIRFAWKPTGSTPKTGYVLEFALDADFDHVLRTSEVDGTSAAISESRDLVGGIYWRVRSKTDKDIVSPVSLARLFPDAPPLLAAPAPNETFSYNVAAGESGKSVKLSWQDHGGASSFETEVAEDLSFQKVVFSRTLGATELQVPPLKEGVYHWRVLGQNPAGKIPRWSDVRTFQIKASGVAPDAPEFRAPLVTYEIPPALIERLPASVPESGPGIRPDKTNLVNLAPVAKAIAYELEISRSADFSGAKTESSTVPSFTPSEVRPGLYYLRAKAKTAEGISSAASQAAQLEVLVPPPNPEPMKPIKATYASAEEAEKASVNVSLKWSPRPWTAAYEVEIATDREFTRKKSLRVAEPRKDIAILNSGPYLYRVRALASDGRPISRFSEAEAFSFAKEIKAKPVATPVPTPIPVPVVVKREPPPPPPGPSLIEPKPQTRVIAMAGANAYVIFRWDPIAGASGYRLQLSASPDFKEFLSDVKVNTTRFVYESQMPSGSLYWRVRAEKVSVKPPGGRGVAGEEETPQPAPSLWSDTREIIVKGIR